MQIKNSVKKSSPKLLLKYNTYAKLLEEYLTLDEFKSSSPLTISAKRVTIVSLMNHLGDSGIISIQNCRQKDVTNYLISISNLASSTISGRTFILRHFFNYLYDANFIMYSGRELFPVIFTNKRERVLSFYSPNEIKMLVSSVDRTTLYGKRDFAVILLAGELGIRSGDIVRMKLSDIHWERNTIEFTQYKTKIFNRLPLLDNIKYALLDYLKNSRPTNQSELIFIGVKNGGHQLTNACIHGIVSKYFKKAGIDISKRKHGPHAMRHSLASTLLHNNTPMHIIKDVLGHSNLNTTRMYLNIDIDKLKTVSLEVPYEEE